MTVILGTNVRFGFGADGVFDLGNVTAGFFGSVMVSPLVVADPGVEPGTEDYESSVIPFHQPAIIIYVKN